MTTIRHGDYQATVEFDEEAGVFHGEIINLRDVVTFQGTSVVELEAAFRASVADYLAFCKELSVQTDKPYSG